jgi:hypothetical protein
VHRLAVGFCLAACTLAGCGGLQQTFATQRAISTRLIAPGVKGQDLVYVGDQLFDEVYVFSYPALEWVGTLTGFSLPAGLCSDKDGNVFVTDLLAQRIVEYAHGGSDPIETLQEKGYPQGCSVDPVTGDLAVTDYSSSAEPGRITIFRGTRRIPHIYRDPTISFSNCGFDDRGNLFADGLKYSNEAGLAELAAGADKLADLRFKEGFDAVGSIQWDGRHVVVMGNSPRVILQLAVSESKVSVVARTKLLSPRYSFSFWIVGKTILLTYVPPHTRVKYTALGVWAYPGGGKPKKSIHNLLDTDGVTLSIQ